MRLPLLQLLLILAGSAVVFGLFIARGFTLAEHARILVPAPRRRRRADGAASVGCGRSW